MYNKYYHNELYKLRELAKEFAKAHPAAAPMLTSESVDPDVERLLEGTAFLTGHLQHKIDDEFPEIIHGLMDIIYPHYLRPVPSISIVSFSPKPSLMETIVVPDGTFLSSKERNGVKCIFTTTSEILVHPLQIVYAKTNVKGKQFSISISMRLSGISLAQWNPKELSFYLSGAYTKASNLFACFTKFVSRIRLVTGEGGTDYTIPVEDFECSSFDKSNSLFPYPSQSFSGFALLQEYFIFPEKFLFFKFINLEKWQERGDGSEFKVIFDFFEPPMGLPLVNADDFSLFSVPVVNLFPNETEPVLVDHTKEKIRLRPSSKSGTGFQIYSVDKVTGFAQGSVKPVEYFPMDFFSSDSDDKSFFRTVRAISPITNSYEVYLFLAYSNQKTEYGRETLSIEITCTNGAEPEYLMPGDICEHTSNSPEVLDFTNITPPTSYVDPPLEGDTLWRMLSHISLNLLSLADTESFKKILKVYIFPDSRDKVKVAANLKRIQGIKELKIQQEDRLVKGMVVRGHNIFMSVSGDNFASMGDVVVFGSVMDEFFSRYSSINTYTRFTLVETVSGESFSWRPRIGAKKL